MIKEIKKLGYYVRKTNKNLRNKQYNILELVNTSDQGKELPCNDTTIYVNCSDVKTKEEALEKINNGNALATKSIDLYKAYYNLSDIETSFLDIDISEKGQRSIVKELEKLGYIKTYIYYEGHNEDLDTEYIFEVGNKHCDFAYVSSAIQFHKIKKTDLFCIVETIYSCDECGAIFHIVNKKLTEKEVIQLYSLMMLKLKIGISEFKEYVIINGNKLHWTDLDNDIFESINKAVNIQYR